MEYLGPYVLEWLNMLVRWLHVITGIAWIGASFYFVWLDNSLRAPAPVLERNRRGASALWPHGISGDLPIVLLRIDDPDDQEIARQLLRAHEYWRMKGLAVDLVIVNEQPVS